MRPGCTPPPAVTQDGDLQFDGGGKQTGPRPLPLPQPQGFSSPGLGRGVCRVGVGPCVGGGPLLPLVIGGKGGCRPWCWQLPRAWLSDPSGFGAALGVGSCHGSWKRFFRRRDSRGRPRTNLQLYGLLPILASRVWAWAASRIFITRAREGSVPSWGRALRGRWPAPSLSDRGEGRLSSVVLAAAACLALGPEWLRSRSRRRLLPRQLEEVLPPTR